MKRLALFVCAMLLSACSSPTPIVIVVQPTLAPSSTPRVVVPPTPTPTPISIIVAVTATLAPSNTRPVAAALTLPPSQTPTLAPTAVTTPTPTIPLSCPASDSIDWSAASVCIGQIKTVCGLVADASYQPTTNGRPTFLNVGNPFPKTPRFTVLIWGINRAKFPQPPDELYLNRTICTLGKIAIFGGLPEIEALDSTQITIQ